jgi:O-antigen/teichoic acid export membrane protein
MNARSSPRSGTLARVIQNVGWLLAGKGVGAVLSLVYLGLATRTLHPAGFGQFALVLGVAQAVVALVSFQTWQIVIRFGMGHLAAQRRDALARLTSLCVLLDVGAAVAGCGVAALLVFFLNKMLGLPAELQWPALGFCVVMLLSIRSTAVGLLRLHDRFGAGALADSSTSFIRLFGTLLAVWTDPSVRGFLLAWGAAELVTAASYWLLVAHFTPQRVTLVGPAAVRLAMLENPGLRRFAGITNLGATLAAVGKQLPVLIVGSLLGAVSAGTYRLAYQLAQALARASDMFARAAFAELSRVHAGGRSDELQRLVGQTNRLAAVAGVTIAAVLIVAGHRLLHAIAGPGYDAAYPLLILLGLAASLDVAAVGYEPLLMATGGAGRAFRIRLVITSLLLIGLFSGTLMIGAVGAGVAMVLASALGLLLLGQATRRRIG